MLDQNKNPIEIAESGSHEDVKKALQKMVKVDRRVISRKETVGYMLFDASAGFNIDGQEELFVDSILKISLKKQSIYNIFGGIWDVIDDFVIGGIVEKTRTRWGKFVPYIFMVGVPYAILVGLYWLLPFLFSAEHVNNMDYMPKFIAYIVFKMLIETVNNFKTVATSGYLSTITPYPSDRRRLLSVAKYCNLFYAGLPNTILEFMLDFITNDIIKSTEERSSTDMIRLSLGILGPFTAVVVGLVCIWYGTMAHERVHQSVNSPKIGESLRVVFTNRPVLVYMISNALSSFGTGISTNNYYRWVLFMTTFETFAGIPSVFFQPIGYSKYNKLASKYSTKTLYMLSKSIPKGMYIPLFLFGLLFKTKDGSRLFTNRWAMLPVTAVWEIIYASFQGIGAVSGDEIVNECNDYIEWKTGCRNEALLSVASTVMCKIPNRVNEIFKPMFKEWIGYDQLAYTEKRPQTEHAQKWIFGMATVIPGLLAITSLLPMLAYNIDKDTRDKMYRELNESRVAHADAVNAMSE